MRSTGGGGSGGGAVGGWAGVLGRVDAAVAELWDVDLAVMGAEELSAFLGGLEAVGRRFEAARIGCVATIDRDVLYSLDRHRTPRAMLRHVCRVSDREAARRCRVGRVVRHLEVVAAAFRAGDVGVGVDHVDRFALAWANPRVRDHLPAVEAAMVAIARTEPYRVFADAMTTWERRVDRDGTIDADSIEEKAFLHREFDQTWRFEGRFSSARGVLIEEVFHHYLAAELTADWDKARVEHGPDATYHQLPRSARQRSADAFFAMVMDAASTPPDARSPKLQINLVMWWHEYQQELTRLAGDTGPSGGAGGATPGVPTPGGDVDDGGPGDGPDRSDGGLPPDADGDGGRVPGGVPWGRPANLSGDDLVPRCSTLDGTPLDPWDATTLSIHAHLRRVVIGADRAIIDIGHARRFTGTARHAALLHHPRCIWPGCGTPTSGCHADHTTPHSHGGATAPHNAAPLCGPHNRAKNHGYRTWRDPTGHWHTHRPDGTEI